MAAATRASARASMLKAYAAVRVCRALGSEAHGGLEDAFAVAHAGAHGATSKAGRAIDRILIDPRATGGVPGTLPGTVAAEQLHQTDFQVPGASGALRTAPDHRAVRVTFRLSDIEKPPPRPRYSMLGLRCSAVPVHVQL